ncbi:hypothetical protein [Acinetobacter sp. ANC 4639]
MKKIIQITCLILGTAFSSTVFSQIIWQKAAKGMTVNQVKTVFPEAKDVLPTEGTTLGDGALRLLAIQNYRINGFTFNPSFYFKDKKLIQVTLNADPNQNQMVVYLKMLEAFRLKYGKEANTVDMSIGEEKIWITPDKTTVKVSYMIGKTSIYYSAREADELNKL